MPTQHDEQRPIPAIDPGSTEGQVKAGQDGIPTGENPDLEARLEPTGGGDDVPAKDEVGQALTADELDTQPGTTGEGSEAAAAGGRDEQERLEVEMPEAAQPEAVDAPAIESEEAAATAGGVEGETAPGDAAVAAGGAAVEPGPEGAGEAPLPDAETAAEEDRGASQAQGPDRREAQRRRRLLVALAALLLLFVCVGAMFWRYLRAPAPVPDLLPIPVNVNYAPHYLFSIYGVEQPGGVAVSPEGDRVYVTESGGERLVKAFDRTGQTLAAFAPPGTRPAERAPVYLAVDASGWVYVADRLQRAVFVYDGTGQHLDTILDPELTLSEYVAGKVGPLVENATIDYNLFEASVHYRLPDGTEHTLPAPERAAWAPLGVRIGRTGGLLLTDVDAAGQCVREIPADTILAATWQQWAPAEGRIGAEGHGDGEFLFPNVALVDSQNRLYVTDGNNGRVCVWDAARIFLRSFGQGIGEEALSLPRGAAIDGRDRLHVVDAVEQCVKVYDVSGEEPRFLFAFGDWGAEEGEFNYPNDIALDTSGRLYVADRENNRVQVWSY